MKKPFLAALLLAVTMCGAAFGAEQITADEAFNIALQPSDDPIIGVWRMYPISGGRAAHMAIVPNTTNRRQNWSYLGIMLEDGFQIKKNGVKIALRQTNFAHIYDVILSNRANRAGDIYLDGNGFAFLNGTFLDMNRVELPYTHSISFDDSDRYAQITHMIKVRDFQMETINKKSSLSGLSFNGLNILSVESGSIADRAGMKPGDTILEINGKPADEKMQKDIDARLAVGRSVTITYERDGNKDIATLQ